MEPEPRQPVDAVLRVVTAVCLVAVLLFTPLAFGGVEPWARSVAAVLAYTALAAVLIRAALGGRFRHLLNPLLIPCGLAVALVAFQSADWPAGLMEVLSPRTVQLHRTAAAAAGPARRAWLPASVYPHATGVALISVTSLVALLAAAYGHLDSWRSVRRTAGLIVAAGFVVALVGILQDVSGARRLYWWRELSHGGAPFGPFVSRNQFAAYAALTLFVGLGLVLAHVAGAAGGAAEKVRTDLVCLLAIALAVIATGVLLSLSRGAILASLVAFGAVFLVVHLRGLVRGKGLYVAAVAAAVLGGAVFLQRGPIAERIVSLRRVGRSPSAKWRWMMAGDAARMGADFAAVGSGAGTFLSAYPLYRTLPTRAVATSPHNEYAHVFAETGAVGLLILVATVALLGWTVGRGVTGKSPPRVFGFVVAAGGGLMTLLLHSVFDFPFRAPGVAFTAVVVVSLLCRAAESAREGASAGDGEGEADRQSVGRSTGRRALVGVFVAAILLGWVIACDFALNPLRGQLEGRLIERQPARDDAGRAAAFVAGSRRSLRAHSHGNGRLYELLADYALRVSRASTGPEAAALAGEALNLRQRAWVAEPANAEHPFNLAALSLYRWRPAEDDSETETERTPSSEAAVAS